MTGVPVDSINVRYPATASPPMTEIGIDHLYQLLTSRFDDFPIILITGMAILRTRTTKTIAAKRKAVPLIWSKSKAAGIPRIPKRGSNAAYQPLSLAIGTSLRLNNSDVTQETIRAIKTMTARVFGSGDLMKMLIIASYSIAGIVAKNPIVG